MLNKQATLSCVFVKYLVHVLLDTRTVLTSICDVCSHSREVLVSASDEATTTAT